MSKINYDIRRSKRAKRIKVSVYPSGAVTVTLPYILPKKFAEDFVEEKADWILSKIDYFKRNKKLPNLNTYQDYRNHKKEALSLIKERVDYFNRIYNFPYNRISVKNQKTRWGSCSKKANLNFNYKVLFLPQRFRDYIIVHELCHLKEMNHSPNFWNLVAQTFPDHKEIRKELKKMI